MSAKVLLCMMSWALPGAAGEPTLLAPKIKCAEVVTITAMAGYPKTFIVDVSNEGQSDLVIERVFGSCESPLVC